MNILEKLVAKLKKRLYEFLLYPYEEDEDLDIEYSNLDDSPSKEPLNHSKGFFGMIRSFVLPVDYENDAEDSDAVSKNPVIPINPPSIRGGFDKVLLILVILTASIGIIVIFGLTATESNRMGDAYYYLQRQSMFVIVGIAMMLFISFVDYRFVKKIAWPLFAVALIIAILVPFIGVGSYRKVYLDIGNININVPTLFCVAMTILVAKLTGTDKKFGTSSLILTGIIVAVSSGIVLVNLDFSAGIIMFFIGLIICFMKKPGVFVFLSVITILMLLFYYQSLGDYGSSRIVTWLDPFVDPQGRGWQTLQSYNIIAAGGVLGKGLGIGSEYLKYMPDVENGYILSGISFQLGIVGAVLVLTILSLIIARIIITAIKASDSFGFYLAAGIGVKFLISIILNTLSVVNVIPPANYGGLPFISYAGSSLVLDFVCIGIILNISRYSSVSRPLFMQSQEE